MLRDEIRLDLHLAGMELRNEWVNLEGKLPDLEAVNHLREVTTDAVEALTEELRRFATRLHARREAGDAVRLMTAAPVTCTPTETLAQVVTRMWDRDIGWLPVVDDGRLLGVVTDRDTCIAACTRGRRLDELSVASVMSQEVWSCAPEDSLHEVLALMREHQIRRVPVVDGCGHLMGVVTLGDIARADEGQPDHLGLHAAYVGAALAEITRPRGRNGAMH